MIACSVHSSSLFFYHASKMQDAIFDGIFPNVVTNDRVLVGFIVALVAIDSNSYCEAKWVEAVNSSA